MASTSSITTIRDVQRSQQRCNVANCMCKVSTMEKERIWLRLGPWKLIFLKFLGMEVALSPLLTCWHLYAAPTSSYSLENRAQCSLVSSPSLCQSAFPIFSPSSLLSCSHTTSHLSLGCGYHKKGYEETEAKAGVHHGTYNVYVNFIPINDITYINKSLSIILKKIQ